ncbi:MAG: alpha-amylase family glycosyl hydrolase [Myxococcales bacterium]
MRRGALAAALALAGCIHGAPVTRLEQETPIAAVVLLDEREGSRIDREPKALRQALDRELTRRNLQPERLSRDTLAPLGQTRDSKARAALLAKALGPGKQFLLVELRIAQFDQQLDGRFKWIVETRLMAGKTDALGETSSQDFDVPVFLHDDFEGPREAQEQAADDIARRLGRLLDGHFAGQPGTSTGPPPAHAQAPSAWSARPLYFVLLDRFAPRGHVADPAAWHGGDLSTLRAHLDDLQALGVGAVWLSPVSRCFEGKKGGWGGYHCYWVEDLAAFEPRFGTMSELRSLRDELHARGIRLVLDIVLNHVAPDSPLLREHPDWFHPPKPLLDYGNPREVEEAWLANLPDLAQEKPEVADYLIATVSRWVSEIRPDGLRLDAVKHVPVAFWRRFTGELHGARPGLEIIGEDLEGNADRLAAEARAGGFDALFDFPLRAALLGAACEGAPVGGVAARFGLDRLDPSGQDWATLLDNHDLPRLTTACGGDFERAAAALDLLFLSRGIPTLTYGVEAGLAGKGDPSNRGDLELPVRSPWRTLVAHLAALRAAHPALARGGTNVASASREGFALLRASPDEVAWIAAARGGEPQAPPAGLAFRPLFEERRSGLAIEVQVAPPGAAAARLAASLAPAAARPVHFQADDAPPLGPGDALAVVGAAPELGAWDPARGAPLAVSLPANEAYELKLVVRRARGAVEWEPGPNEVVYVAAGEAPQTVTLRWPAKAAGSG